jgi:hypothetical protein
VIPKARRLDVKATPRCCKLVGGACKDAVPETRGVDALVTVQRETHFPGLMLDVEHHGSNRWLRTKE